MDFCFATFSALFLLLSAASCFPTGHDACGDVRSSSLELNRIAQTVSIKARNGSKDGMDFSTAVAWMEAKDMCDPETLKQQPATCLGKIFSVLTSYISAVERVAGFQSCSKFVNEVLPAMTTLHEDMGKCVQSRTGISHQKESHITEEDPIKQWEEDLLCHYTMDRLFSFSILTARVFAVGDPAHHTDGSAQKCM